MSLKNAAARTIFVAISLLGAPALHAGGFMVAHFGGEHGNPMASNPTSLYFNPAGLAGIGGTQIYLEGDLALRLLHYDRDPAAIDGTGHDDAYVAADSGEGG